MDTDVNVFTVEKLQNLGEQDDTPVADVAITTGPTDIACLMLTSGSTGNSKAVVLTAGQMLLAVAGKAAHRPLPADCTFLNWIGLDHVANLTEIHLQALYLHQHQIHVSAGDIISNPTKWIELLSKHNAGRSFAPNFFLAKLNDELKNRTESLDLDLSNLTFVASGGEANTVSTCAELCARLTKDYKMPWNAIAPGFGMTETCAGSIYNTAFPQHDLTNGYEFASLGHPIPNVEMRVSAVGELEVGGPIVFKRYYNNEKATSESFTEDGWFKTGDQAVFDAANKLRLVGRSKETINVNGVKYSPLDIETAIEEAEIEGIAKSYVIVFPYRRNGMQTESICVAYLPNYPEDDIPALYETNNSIQKLVVLEAGTAPLVLALDSKVLQRSTIGKLSRGQMRSSLESGKLATYEEQSANALDAFKKDTYVGPATPLEKVLVNEFSSVVSINPNEIGVETSVFDLGVNSVSLLKLKRQFEIALGLENIPIATLMINSTIRSLATAIAKIQDPTAHAGSKEEYDPVVTLQPHGKGAPLWLFHPGVGEILVFFNLAKYLTDRPVYALRARGFEQGEEYFADIEEAVSTYHSAIKRYQAKGPYAVAGYSYGAMLAFETAKRLESNGDEVRFMASFNLPPHIKFRMRQLVWSECLLHLAYFLSLITEDYSREVSEQVSQLSRSDAVDFVLEAADKARLQELALSRAALENWACLAFGLQGMAREYDPSGSLRSIDVFIAIPLAVVAETKALWIEKHLSKWADFSDTPPVLHDVDGSHYTMIGEDHVFSFQKKLRKALKARGL